MKIGCVDAIVAVKLYLEVAWSDQFSCFISGDQGMQKAQRAVICKALGLQCFSHPEQHHTSAAQKAFAPLRRVQSSSHFAVNILSPVVILQ